LGPDVTVICLNEDARQFGFAFPVERWAGANILLVIADRADSVLPVLNGMFSGGIETLPPSAVTLRGRLLRPVTVARGLGLNASKTPS